MTESSDSKPVQYRQLRVWIPVILVLLMVVARYFSVWFPEMPMVWMVGAFVPALLGILILLWWLTLSRATWVERLVGLIGAVSAIFITTAFMHSTMKGAPVVVLTMPTTLAGFALALAVLSRVPSFRRTAVAIVFAFLVAGFSLLLRNSGATGDFGFEFDWRWRATPEEVFLAQRRLTENNDSVRFPTTAGLENPAWPGFRGPKRDGIQRGVVFDSNWKARPPKELWRIKLGPAWSSFAVADTFLFTQEQRGDYEAIVCYDADSGREVWDREIESRFFDELGGLGPRATPTIAAGSVYALGAEGWLVKLDATDGTILWQTNLKQWTEKDPPMWGYSCSPLVVGDLVAVHAAGEKNNGIIAFDTQTGDVRWSVAADKDSYSSLHQTEFFGGTQIVFLGNSGATFLEPTTGNTLHKHDFQISGYRALQPAVVDSDKLLFTSEYAGSRLIQLFETEQGLSSKEIWTTRNIKPDFNDLVVYQRSLYGFDGAIFACINMETGYRHWKQGRYGKGQVLLLEDSGLLLVVSETGELVLLKADPKDHIELATISALNGKTWNHPVVVGDRLYLRNANEAVCYQLPTIEPVSTTDNEDL